MYLLNGNWRWSWCNWGWRWWKRWLGFTFDVVCINTNATAKENNGDIVNFDTDSDEDIDIINELFDKEQYIFKKML